MAGSSVRKAEQNLRRAEYELTDVGNANNGRENAETHQEDIGQEAETRLAVSSPVILPLSGASDGAIVDLQELVLSVVAAVTMLAVCSGGQNAKTQIVRFFFF